MRYKNDAVSLINKLDKFDYKAFELWVTSQNILIGSGHILSFIEEQRRWNTTPLNNGELRFNISYSKQALGLILQFKDFNYDSFATWFCNSIEIEKGDIINYIEAINK
jgi:hypothetical protein